MKGEGTMRTNHAAVELRQYHQALTKIPKPNLLVPSRVR